MMNKYLIASLLLIPFGVLASFDRDLYYGLRSDPQVQELQEFLTGEGLYTGPITGNFFSLTLAGVKNFQIRELVSPISGYFGPISRGKANALLTAVTDESGTPISPAITPPKTTEDVVAKLLEQITLLQSQLAELQKQQVKLDTQQQTLTQQAATLGAIQSEQVKQTAALEQVKVNTTPAPAPVPVPPPAPPPPPLIIKQLRSPDAGSISCGLVYRTVCEFSVKYLENFEPKHASITVSVDDPNGEVSPTTGKTVLDGRGEPRAFFKYFPSGEVGIEPYIFGHNADGTPHETGFRITRTITATANGVTTTIPLISRYFPQISQ